VPTPTRAPAALSYEVGAEQAALGKESRPGLPGRIDEQILVCPPGAFAAQEVGDLGAALGDVGRHREAQLGAGFIELDRNGVRGVRGDAGTNAVGERRARTVADHGEALECGSRLRAEDLEVHRRAETQLRRCNRGRAAVAAIADGRHTRRETFGGAEPSDVDVLLPADSVLSLDVKRDPLRKVAETVAEAPIDGVLEMRVRVDESRSDHGVRVPRPLSELRRGTNGGDAAVLDRDGAVLDRRSVDREDPVR
jgi:hypothetical protein